jgi:hypothetical protein
MGHTGQLPRLDVIQELRALGRGQLRRRIGKYRRVDRPHRDSLTWHADTVFLAS